MTESERTERIKVLIEFYEKLVFSKEAQELVVESIFNLLGLILEIE